MRLDVPNYLSVKYVRRSRLYIATNKPVGVHLSNVFAHLVLAVHGSSVEHFFPRFGEIGSLSSNHSRVLSVLT